MLKLENLTVKTENKKILDKINLEVPKGKLVVVMGPNGCGKSTLAKTIMGQKFEKRSGKILFEGKSIVKLNVDERAKKGIFMSFQNPVEFEGLIIARYLRNIINSRRENEGEKKLSIIEFNKFLKEKLKELGMKENLRLRSLNKGFSGGEKKKTEMLQMKILNPKLSIIDEIDSGLDVDAMKTIGKELNAFKAKDKSIIVITHNNKFLKYLDVDKVFVMKEGTIVKTGTKTLAKEIEKKGFEGF